ncbi:TetR/AcrR family transcriptional regulator [Kitasatospora aburaviensis]
MTTTRTRHASGPRERLLEAAQQLTYSQGVGVGVDALLKAADVARRSLYEHFGGKDGLIAEVLRRSAEADEAAYVRTMAAAGEDPGRGCWPCSTGSVRSSRGRTSAAAVTWRPISRSPTPSTRGTR